eukprot:TRINITY_DN18626_c0_g1_i1.p1 TRINITY_DN18626_c0_g1~~TRINITY_DN18626_c0_g1_i1.p1  ORF type:complete len:360 (-),score=62.31 TRINITY_DN18626_c0_g1_i1:4-1083(-)
MLHPAIRTPWACHPFGGKMARHLLMHCLLVGDVQTQAMLTHVFLMTDFITRTKLMNLWLTFVHASVQEDSKDSRYASPSSNSSGSSTSSKDSSASNALISNPVISTMYLQQNTSMIGGAMYTTNTSSGGFSEFTNAIKNASPMKSGRFARNQRNRTSDLDLMRLEQEKLIESNYVFPHDVMSVVWNQTSILEHAFVYDSDRHTLQHSRTPGVYLESPMFSTDYFFLEESYRQARDHLMRLYADMLFRWGLIEHRAELLRFVTHNDLERDSASITLDPLCKHCGRPQTGPRCEVCNLSSIQCSICHLSVRGLSNYCLNCGHGGHVKHMKQWFANNQSCPVGCGCECQTMWRNADLLGAPI